MGRGEERKPAGPEAGVGTGGPADPAWWTMVWIWIRIRIRVAIKTKDQRLSQGPRGGK